MIKHSCPKHHILQSKPSLELYFRVNVKLLKLIERKIFIYFNLKKSNDNIKIQNYNQNGLLSLALFMPKHKRKLFIVNNSYLKASCIATEAFPLIFINVSPSFCLNE